MDREPIADLTALDNLDSCDFAAGYFAGFNGYGHEPLGEIDTTYYHGQLMGMDDKGRMQPSATYKQLVHEWHERSKKETHDYRMVRPHEPPR
jgi:hypothetical protein